MCRNTEDKLEQKDKLSAEKDRLISTLRSKLDNAKKFIEDCNSQKLRYCLL